MPDFGDFKIEDNTKDVIAALKAAEKRGLEAIGMVCERYAKKETPVDTGRLRNSMTHIIDDNAAYIGTNVEYGIYVELGAQGRQGVHMLSRAATEHREEYARIMKDALK